jgi:DNA polymerase III sliding clamp (beta) subunit (PCNA family)
MELTLSKEQRQVIHAAATEETRPVLAAACIRKDKLIAANGFVMAETTLEGIHEEHEDLLIPAKDLLKAKDIKNMGRIMFHNNGEAGKARLIDNEGEKVVTLVNGTFPNTELLWPKDEPKFRIGLSCEVLSTLLKVAGKDNFVKLTFYGENSPVKFEAPRTESQGLIMPYSVQWK